GRSRSAGRPWGDGHPSGVCGVGRDAEVVWWVASRRRLSPARRIDQVGSLLGGVFSDASVTCSSVSARLPTNRNCSSELPLSSAAYFDLAGARRPSCRYDARARSIVLVAG